LRTDASGRLRIWLNDDTVLNLGSDTVFALEAYEEDPGSSSLASRLSSGLVRVLTGKIVEANPAAFSLTTPEGTIGIRGTIISVRTDAGVSTVYVENTTRQVLFNGIEVPAGHKAIITQGASPDIQPLQPLDRRQLGQDLAFAGRAGAAAAAPEPAWDTGPRDELAGASGTLEAYTSLASIPLNLQLAGNALANNPLPQPSTATVKGSLSSTGAFILLAQGNFDFKMDLSTGVISNATLFGGTTSGPPAATSGKHFNMIGGSGNFVIGGTTLISGFTGNLYSNGTSGPAFPVIATDNTTITLSSGSNPASYAPGSVTGSYTIDATSSGWSNADNGSLSGERVP
jgi:hypothetical protein